MMRLIIALIPITVLLLGSSRGAASPLTDQAAEKLVTDAMDTLATRGVRGVFETVTPYWGRSKIEVESIIADSEAKRERGLLDSGSYLGYEKIGEKKVGSSLMMITALEKDEKRGVVWYFTFYKPKDSWILKSCYWNPNFESLLLLDK